MIESGSLNAAEGSARCRSSAIQCRGSEAASSRNPPPAGASDSRPPRPRAKRRPMADAAPNRPLDLGAAVRAASRPMASSTLAPTPCASWSTTSSRARRCRASTRSRCAGSARGWPRRGRSGRTISAAPSRRRGASPPSPRRCMSAELDVTATEAIRRASNGPELAAAIERESGLKVRVLAGPGGGVLFDARRRLRLLPPRRLGRRHGRRLARSGAGARRPRRRRLGQPAARRAAGRSRCWRRGATRPSARSTSG